VPTDRDIIEFVVRALALSFSTHALGKSVVFDNSAMNCTPNFQFFLRGFRFWTFGGGFSRESLNELRELARFVGFVLFFVVGGRP
jgi:hypothetical protein